MVKNMWPIMKLVLCMKLYYHKVSLGEQLSVHACRSKQMLIKNTDNTEPKILLGRIPLIAHNDLQIALIVTLIKSSQ